MVRIMSELIFFILGIAIGFIGAIGGALYALAYVLASSPRPTKQDVEEFKRELEAVKSNAKATTKAMH